MTAPLVFTVSALLGLLFGLDVVSWLVGAVTGYVAATYGRPF